MNKVYFLTTIAQKKALVSIVFSIIAMFSLASIAQGAVSGAGGTCGGNTGNTCGDNLTCTGGTCVASAGGAAGSLDCGADDPFCLNKAQPEKLGNKDLIETATDIINVALSLLGLVAVVIVLIGGFKWMTAGGNDDKVSEARKLIFSGIIGIAIILSAWAIASFVLNQLQDATGSGSAVDDEL